MYNATQNLNLPFGYCLVWNRMFIILCLLLQFTVYFCVLNNTSKSLYDINEYMINIATKLYEDFIDVVPKKYIEIIQIFLKLREYSVRKFEWYGIFALKHVVLDVLPYRHFDIGSLKGKMVFVENFV